MFFRRCLSVAGVRLADKGQVLYPPTQVRLGLAARYGEGDAGAGIGLMDGQRA
jgi:hypothetical protein